MNGLFEQRNGHLYNYIDLPIGTHCDNVLYNFSTPARGIREVRFSKLRLTLSTSNWMNMFKIPNESTFYVSLRDSILAVVLIKCSHHSYRGGMN
jgi:hypothetical protein